MNSPHEQKLSISNLHLPFIFPAIIFAFVQISRPRKVCTQTLSGATLLAMGCEASQAVATGLESSYKPGLLLPKIISHTPRKLYSQKCFTQFLCILSLLEHFKHLKMHIFLEKGTILFGPNPIFARTNAQYLLQQAGGCMLFSQAVEGWGEGSFSSFHSPQPTAELRPAQCLPRRDTRRVLKVNLK